MPKGQQRVDTDLLLRVNNDLSHPPPPGGLLSDWTIVRACMRACVRACACVCVCVCAFLSHQRLCGDSLWLWPAVCPPLSKTTKDCLCRVEIYPVHMCYGSEPHLFLSVYICWHACMDFVCFVMSGLLTWVGMLISYFGWEIKFNKYNIKTRSI